MHRIVFAEPLAGYRVRIRFADGVEGVVSLADLVGKGVFAAWNHPAVFAQVAIDPVTHTLTWPGGIDLAPEPLYDEIVAQRTAR